MCNAYFISTAHRQRRRLVMEEIRSQKQTLTLTDRKSLCVNCVKNVVGFDGGYVSLCTELGKIVIEGEDLRIEGLSREDGTVHISGSVDAVYYAEEKPAGKSFFKFGK